MIDDELLAFTSLKAYQDPPTIEVDSTQVLICSLGKAVIIAFPGTADFQDLRTDLDADLVSDERYVGTVHDGGRKSLQKVYPQILSGIAGAKEIHLCGHSLGGLLATLFAASYDARISDIKSIVTFGCPRVGDFTFAEDYKKRFGKVTRRYVNNGDVVPLIPFAHWGYHHVCEPVIKRSLGRQWWNLIKWWIGDIGKAGLAVKKNHQMSGYVKRFQLEHQNGIKIN